MRAYTIFYEYYDKRGHRLNKKLMCCGEDRLREKCVAISKLETHKPISTPVIYITSGIDNYIDTVDYDDILGGNLK